MIFVVEVMVIDALTVMAVAVLSGIGVEVRAEVNEVVVTTLEFPVSTPSKEFGT